jgi:hypothetical protein
VSLPPCNLAWGVRGVFSTFLFFTFNSLKEALSFFKSF